jgi:predicted RNA-binding protein YlqC (UPF0109 family)
MSDASGPFAVPNFSQPAVSDDEFDDVDDVDDVDDAEDLDGEYEAEEPTAAPVESATAPVTPPNGGTAQSVLEHIARSIVDEPDAVAVDLSSQRDGIRLDLHVAPSDMGRIIGRRGRVAQALRSVVRAAAAKDGTDATVDIVD